MLTTSPVAPRSTSASPRSFHYAQSRSPHDSPRILAPLPRRLSKSSPTTNPPLRPSPSQQRLRQYVGVDAATQYSPTEPFDPQVPLRAVQAVAPRAGGPPGNSVSMTASTEPQGANAQPPSGPPSEPNVGPRPSDSGASSASANPMSPGKRRNSQDPSSYIARADSVVNQSQSNSPKRPRQNAAPPKELPQRYEFCDVEDLTVLIANMLAELIETNDSIALQNGRLTRFHSRTAPGISVLDYLNRLAKHATLTPPLMLSMVYYIDRLCALYPDFTINTLTVHRFLITAATVAGKGLSDSFWNNSFYARVGGVKVAELKLLELEFLYRVDWKIVPNPEVLVAYYKGLVERCPGYVLQGEENSAESNADDSDELDEGGESEGPEKGERS